MTDTLTIRVNGVRQELELPDGAELDINHPAVQRAARQVTAARKARQEAYEVERKGKPPKPRKRRLPAQPKNSRWRAISSGTYKRRMRPRTSPEDRLYVPAALEHWRKVHGLSRREAQVRIGYSERSCSWTHWEHGFVIPPYGTLLRILSATGIDPNAVLTRVDPGLRLDMDRAQWATTMRQRRVQRKRKQAV